MPSDTATALRYSLEGSKLVTIGLITTGGTKLGILWDLQSSYGVKSETQVVCYRVGDGSGNSPLRTRRKVKITYSIAFKF